MKDEDGFIDQANERDVFIIITDKTPFYAEGGGQVSDIGTWENKVRAQICHHANNNIYCIQFG